MSLAGPAFYDDEVVFATYMQHRQRPDTPNDTLEKPVILDVLGGVAGQHILDLGCGDARFGRELLEHGVARYVGVEGSQKMVTVARGTLAGTGGEVVPHTIEEWTYPATTFDLVVARLVFHYLADLAPLFAQIFHTLRPDGRLIFSIEHPVITSCDRGWPSGSLRQDWLVDNYFDTGLRVTNWLGGTVQKYHRTVEEYFTTLQCAGFRVEHLREAHPQREHFTAVETYERRKRIPLFLVLAGRKPSTTQ